MAKSSLSELEVVGVALAAAGALGGVVVALSRAQANAAPEDPVRKQIARLRAVNSPNTPQSLEHLYGEATELVGRVQPELTARARTLREALPGQHKKTVWQRLPLPRRKRSRWEQLSKKAQQSLSAEQVQATAMEAMRAIQPRIAAARPAAEAARRQFQQSLAEIRESERVQQTGPALRELAERFDEVRHDATDALADAPQRIAELASEAAQQVREAAPETPVVELPPPKAVAKRGGSAAKETLATLAWLAAASAIVYFVILSAERREQLKTWVCSGLEQIQLLALDFKGYEPDE